MLKLVLIFLLAATSALAQSAGGEPAREACQAAATSADALRACKGLVYDSCIAAPAEMTAEKCQTAEAVAWLNALTALWPRVQEWSAKAGVDADVEQNQVTWEDWRTLECATARKLAEQAGKSGVGAEDICLSELTAERVIYLKLQIAGD